MNNTEKFFADENKDGIPDGVAKFLEDKNKDGYPDNFEPLIDKILTEVRMMILTFMLGGTIVLVLLTLISYLLQR